MPRPRAIYNDCVVAVFRELTGEDEQNARIRFCRHLTGDPGISWEALRSCLASVGRTLTPCADATQEMFGKHFQGEAVVFYAKGANPVHVILIRSGGIVLDPSTDAPEDGEFFDDYFKRIGGDVITIKHVSIVVGTESK